MKRCRGVQENSSLSLESGGDEHMPKAFQWQHVSGPARSLLWAGITDADQSPTLPTHMALQEEKLKARLKEPTVGAPGPPGYHGSNGREGLTGLTGPTGSKGRPGPQGVAGEMGKTGVLGDQGPIGPEGQAGFAGPFPQRFHK